MRTSVGVGLSNKISPRQAAKDAILKALKPLKDQEPGLVLIFTTSVYPPQEILAGLKPYCGNAQLVGCCGAGVITPQGFSYDSLAVMAIASNQLKFFSALQAGLIGAPHSSGKKIARKLKTKSKAQSGSFPDTYLLFPEGFQASIDEFLQGMHSVIGPDSYMIGGGSGDNLNYSNTYQIAENGFAQDGVSATLICSNLPVGMGYGHGWQPDSKQMLVSKAEHKKVKEIDGRPAIKAYLDYFGQPESFLEPKNFRKNTLHRPLGIPEKEDFILRSPWHPEADGSINFVSPLPENSPVHIMKADSKSILSATRKAAESACEMLPRKPAFALVFDCIARILVLNKKVDEEFKIIQQTLGEDVPLIGFLSFGEIASGGKSKANLLNKSVVVWTVSS